MDRQVAAGWYDFMMVDPEFLFRNFTHNIPQYTINSCRSSFVSGYDEMNELQSGGSSEHENYDHHVFDDIFDN